MGRTTVRDVNAENGLRTAETEIDLLGIGRGATEYLVGECKFKKSPFSYSEYLDTAAKMNPQKQKAEFHYALFSGNGFDEKLIKEAEKADVSLYSLETIVNYK